MNNWPPRGPQDPRLMGRPTPMPDIKKQPQQMMTLEEFQALEKPINEADKIMENLRVNTWDQKFLYKTVNTDNLQSIFLDSNQRFQDLRQMLQQYNKEILAAEEKGAKVRNGAWRSVFYVQLLELMRQIILTTNRDLQTKLVDKVHAWAHDQIAKLDYLGRNKDKPLGRPETGKSRPFSSTGRPQSGITTKSKGMRPLSGYPHTSVAGGETLAETTMNLSFDTRPDSAANINTVIQEDGTILIRNNRDIHSAVTRDNSKKQPSEMINDQMRDYNYNARTKHQNYEPPKERLQNYKRRLLSSLEPRERKATLPEVARDPKQRTFPKPQSALPRPVLMSTMTKDLPSGVESGDQDLDLMEQQRLQIADIQQQQSTKVNEETVPLDPRFKTFVKDEDENVQKPKVVFETKSTYTHYIPESKEYEMRVEDAYIKNRQREVRQKRQDEELIGMMKEWSTAKGRIEKESNRRIESANIGSHFAQVKMEPRTDKEQDRVYLDKAFKKHQQVMKGELEANHEDLYLSDELENQEQEEEIEEIDEQENFIEGDSEMIEEEKQEKFKVRKIPKPPKMKVIEVAQRRPKSHAPKDTDIHDLELNINNHKVDQVKKLHGNLIGLLDPASLEESPVKGAPSMSVFNQGVPKAYRPFSAALEQCPIDRMRQEQLKEISEVKARLAKHKIHIPVSKLMTAMLVPPEVSDVQQLPAVGNGMLDRETKKKKKKKSKKRR